MLSSSDGLDVHVASERLTTDGDSVQDNISPRNEAGPSTSHTIAAPIRYRNGENPKLRYIKPYWWPYKTFVKQRWIGRELLEVVSTEFRDRSVEYYKHALESGVTKVNGAIAYPGLILRDGDRIDNTVHRHEPPISNDSILVLHIDRERKFIVISKPGSVPVHATGRYFRHTVLELMKLDYGIECFAVNRLDRLTSGLMIMALSGPASRDLANEFIEGTVKKEYVARVRGKFPEHEIEVDKPLLTVDRQMGLVIITPEGKEAKTVFKRMSYDEKRDQSVVRCRPLTGRTHQIRVHLQYLGHPIANDPLYSLPSVWGPTLGAGGVELVPQTMSSQRAAIAARLATPASGNSRISASAPGTPSTSTPPDAPSDRDMQNIDLSSPIMLSQQAKDVIVKLRRMKDEAEDWIKWKEVIFNVKEAQDDLDAQSAQPSSSSSSSKPTRSVPHPREVQRETHIKGGRRLPDPIPDDQVNHLIAPVHLPEGFCKQCFVPLPDDPDPETLFIYLHALKYSTRNLGTWETPLPRWAGEEWDGDWRGWAEGQEVVSAVERLSQSPSGWRQAILP